MIRIDDNFRQSIRIHVLFIKASFTRIFRLRFDQNSYEHRKNTAEIEKNEKIRQSFYLNTKTAPFTKSIK